MRRQWQILRRIVHASQQQPSSQDIMRNGSFGARSLTRCPHAAPDPPFALGLYIEPRGATRLLCHLLTKPKSTNQLSSAFVVPQILHLHSAFTNGPHSGGGITSYVFSLLSHTKPKSTNHLHLAYVKNSIIRCKPFILVWTIHDGGLSCDKQNMSWKSFISFQLQCWKWKKEKENKPCRTPVSAKLARRAILPLLCVCWGILALVWSIRNA